KPRHDLASWVRGEVLRRFNFRCCQSVEEFNDVAGPAMTENRHVKYNSQRHQKDDRPRTVDPRHFVLGWDNTAKKKRIAERIRELEAELAGANEAVENFAGQIAQREQIRRAAQAALEVTDFDAIDVRRHQRKIAALRQEQAELEEANDAVKSLRQRLKA